MPSNLKEQIVVGVVVGLVLWWLTRKAEAATKSTRGTFEFSEEFLVNVPCKIGEPNCRPLPSQEPIEKVWRR